MLQKNDLGHDFKILWWWSISCWFKITVTDGIKKNYEMPVIVIEVIYVIDVMQVNLWMLTLPEGFTLLHTILHKGREEYVYEDIRLLGHKYEWTQKYDRVLFVLNGLNQKCQNFDFSDICFIQSSMVSNILQTFFYYCYPNSNILELFVSRLLG